MRYFVNIFTAASLIVHAMIGCCHSHRHETTCQAVEISEPACCCCHHGAVPQETSPPSAPCRGEHQCQGVCNYLPTHKPTVDGGNAHHFVRFLCVSSQANFNICTEVENFREHPHLGSSPPHLRLHLLNQILLI